MYMYYSGHQTFPPWLLLMCIRRNWVCTLDTRPFHPGSFSWKLGMYQSGHQTLLAAQRRVWGITLLGSVLLECHGFHIRQTSFSDLQRDWSGTQHSFASCHLQQNSNAGWVNWCSFPINTTGSIPVLKILLGKIFPPRPFLTWSEGSGVLTSYVPPLYQSDTFPPFTWPRYEVTFTQHYSLYQPFRIVEQCGTIDSRGTLYYLWWNQDQLVKKRRGISSDSGRSNFHQKVQALAIIKSKYLYTRRKVSVSSVERSQLVVANSVDAEVTCVFNFSHTNFN